MTRICKGIWPAVAWLVLSFILLILPSSALPKAASWTSALYVDKWVHVCMFAILVWLFCRGIAQKKYSRYKTIFIFLGVVLAAALYGVAMEYVQRDFVANRSYDTGDILADVLGACVGLLISWIRYIKK